MTFPRRRIERWDQVGFLLSWFLVFLIPWGDMMLLPVQVQASRVFTLVAAAAWIPLLWRGRSMRPLESSHYWMLLFVLWAGLNVVQSAEPERTLRRVLSFVQLFLDAWIIHQSIRSTERYHKLLYAWVLGCCVCLGGLTFNFLQNIFQGDGRFTAPGFDPNDLAVTLVLGIPAAWYLSVREPATGWLIRLYIPIAIAATFLTASRGAVLTLAIVLLLPSSTIPKHSAKALVGVAVLISLCGFAVAGLSTEISFRRLSTIIDQVSARDLNGRIDIWRRGYAAFLDAPFVGVGAGGFENAIGAARGSGLAAHNAILGIAVEHGLVGLLFFLGVLAALLHRAWKNAPQERKLWVLLLLAWCVAAMSLSWENREMTWLLWGMCAAQPKPARRSSPQFIIWRPRAQTTSSP